MASIVLSYGQTVKFFQFAENIGFNFEKLRVGQSFQSYLHFVLTAAKPALCLYYPNNPNVHFDFSEGNGIFISKSLFRSGNGNTTTPLAGLISKKLEDLWVFL